MLIFITRLKVLVRNKGLMFWTFIFPLALGTIFYFAFGNLSTGESMKTYDLPCVVETEYSIKNDMRFYNQVLATTYDETNKLFKIEEFASVDLAREAINNGDIQGYLFYDGGTIKFVSNQTSSDGIVIKAFLQQYAAANVLVENAIAAGKTETEISQMLTELFSDTNYLVDVKAAKETNPFVIFFYGLISMMCMFSSYFGLTNMFHTRADMSDLGIRISLSPVHKFKVMSLYTASAMTLMIISNTIFFIYLKYVLGVGFGSADALILLAMYVGSFSGIAFGMVSSCIIKGSINKLTNINTVISLVLSFLAGLMSVDVKHMIDSSVPFLNFINPAGSLCNALYCLYYYDNLDLYFTGIGCMLLVSAVFVAITFFRTRGEKYANL